jgi:alkanesulfonate monooxygenase SsuD/methylene tetrahydromethanopterin reductase-like flavin-dependent oxidoreductase (luciferase family)
MTARVADRDQHDQELSDVTVDDFMTGLIAGIASHDVRVVSIRNNLFYQAVVEAFDEFRVRANAAGVQPRFSLRLNKIYGDSPAVRDALTRAVQRDLVSLDNPEYQDMRLKIGARDAEAYLDKIAGGRQLYSEVAERFLSNYPSYV